jgi:hypothetical protein
MHTAGDRTLDCNRTKGQKWAGPSKSENSGGRSTSGPGGESKRGPSYNQGTTLAKRVCLKMVEVQDETGIHMLVQDQTQGSE